MEEVLLDIIGEKWIVNNILIDAYQLEHRENFLKTLNKIKNFKQKNKFNNYIYIENTGALFSSTQYLNNRNPKYKDSQILYISEGNEPYKIMICDKKINIEISTSDLANDIILILGGFVSIICLPMVALSMLGDLFNN